MSIESLAIRKDADDYVMTLKVDSRGWHIIKIALWYYANNQKHELAQQADKLMTDIDELSNEL